jgi:hypothetical protein
MRLEGTRDQPDAADEQDQHYDGVEKARWLKIDVQVGDYSRKNKKGPGNGKNPADYASTVPEEYAHTEQHGDEGDTEGVRSIEIPVGTDHADLIGQEVSADARHSESHQEEAEAAGRAPYIAERTVFHGWEDTRPMYVAVAGR